MSPDPVEEALAEAARRCAIADRDVSASVEHFGDVVRQVCAGWELTVEHWCAGGAGTPPLAVRRRDGSPAVLKIAEPGVLDAQACVMTADGGRGYARVLNWDAGRGALLLERLGHDLASESTGLVAQGRVLVPLLEDAWLVPLSVGVPFHGKAAGLLQILAELGPRYGSRHERALEVATEYAHELALFERPEVVCHGDPHAGNALRRRAGWALVDPDGFVGERAYDVGVVIRDGCQELADAEARRPGAALPLLHDVCRQLAGLAGVDPARVWRWGFVERVTTGLYLHWHGYPREATAFLDTATVLAG